MPCITAKSFFFFILRERFVYITFQSKGPSLSTETCCKQISHIYNKQPLVMMGGFFLTLFRMLFYESCWIKMLSQHMPNYQLLHCCVLFKGGYTLVTLPCIVTLYRGSVDRTRDRLTHQTFCYAVTLRACLVCCWYLAIASKGWYSCGQSRCGCAMWCRNLHEKIKVCKINSEFCTFYWEF
jgi:hypothetical protein